MKIDVYKSAKSGNKYLSVPSGTKVELLELPADTDPDLLSLSPFKTRIELDPNRPRSALKEAEVEADILLNGYAIHGAEITITVGVSAS